MECFGSFHVKRSAFSATGFSVVISVIFRALRGGVFDAVSRRRPAAIFDFPFKAVDLNSPAGTLPR